MAKCVGGNSLHVLIGSIWNDIFHQLPLKQSGRVEEQMLLLFL
jgi:hypothetical protein